MSVPDLLRRGFLRGLATLPLIGGGVMLIGKVAAPVPLVDVAAAAPILGDPHERARYAWAAFSAALREIAVDAHGWHVQGGERLPFRDLPGGAWLTANHIDYQTDTEPRCRSLIVERLREVGL